MRIVGFLAIFVLAVGITVAAHAEYESPQRQLDSGVAPEMVRCNDGKALMLSVAGSPVCVTARTSERLMDRGYVPVVPDEKTGEPSYTEQPEPEPELESKPQPEPEPDIPLDMESLRKSMEFIKEEAKYGNHKSEYRHPDMLSPEELRQITKYNMEDENYIFYREPEGYEGSIRNTSIIVTGGLEKIPNPDGDWYLDIDKESFAGRVADALDTEISHVEDNGVYILQNKPTRPDDGTAAYFAEIHRASVSIAGFPVMQEREDNHKRRSSTTITFWEKIPPSEQVAFIDNFMETMGYRFGDATIEEWMRNCDSDYDSFAQCQIVNRGTQIVISDQDHRLLISDYSGTPLGFAEEVKYWLKQPFSSIGFTFYPSPEMSSRIGLGAWTNHPDLVHEALDRQVLTIQGGIPENPEPDNERSIGPATAWKKAAEAAVANNLLDLPDCTILLYDKNHKISDYKHADFFNKARQLYERAEVDFSIIGGIPYYVVTGIGGCIPVHKQPDMWHGFPNIAVDAWTGDLMYIE